MQAEFGTVLAVVGLYLSLISILGSLFFIHLGNWYKDISTTEQKWMQFKYDEGHDARRKHIECYLEAYDEKNPLPIIGFALLTLFMVTLGAFSLQLKGFIPAQNSLIDFLYWPLYLFFGLYVVVSIVYLILGYRKVRKLYDEIDQKLSQ